MNKKPNEKPIFLYIVIGILTVAVIALAAVSFLSLNHLVTLQQKVQTLSKTVEEISTDANTLISQADQLDELRTGKFCQGSHRRNISCTVRIR